MASDTTSLKRKAPAALSHAVLFGALACSACHQHFAATAADDERAPRVLLCGHTFCTACLRALVRKLGARKWTIACPVDGHETPVDKGDVATLTRNLVLLPVCAADGATLLRKLFITNMGGDVFTIIVRADDTVRAAKRHLQELRAMPAHLQVWFIPTVKVDANDDENATESIVLHDDRTLASYQLVSGAHVRLTMLDGFRGGTFVRSIKVKYDDADADHDRQSDLGGMCISFDGELLCVCDPGNVCVSLMRTSDFSLMRTIKMHYADERGRRNNNNDERNDRHRNANVAADAGNDDDVVDDAGDEANEADDDDAAAADDDDDDNEFEPAGACFSANNELLFVCDASNGCVRVFRVADGAHIRTLGSPAARYHDFDSMQPCDVCVSPDGALLYVVDSAKACVQVLRVTDGVSVRTLGASGTGAAQLQAPVAACLSPDGDLIFVTDQHASRVQVFHTSDGTHVRSIGCLGRGEGEFDAPHGVCVSPSGEWLFVADCENRRVQVFRVADGMYVHTIGAGRENADRGCDSDCERAPQLHGVSDGQFDCPMLVCVAPNGDHFFVLDIDQRRVVMLTLD